MASGNKLKMPKRGKKQNKTMDVTTHSGQEYKFFFFIPIKLTTYAGYNLKMDFLTWMTMIISYSLTCNTNLTEYMA